MAANIFSVDDATDRMGTPLLRLIIPGTPAALPRPKLTARGGFARMYMAETDQDGKPVPYVRYRNEIQLQAKVNWRQRTDRNLSREPIDQPICVHLDFVFPRLKHQVWKRKPMPRIPKQEKPDLDNLVKGVLDALNGRVWKDDARITELTARKWIASGEESPHTLLRVWLPGEDDE